MVDVNMCNRKPMLLVLAGPNGSGKSTLLRDFETIGAYTNADEMVVKFGITNEVAATLVDAKRYKSIENKEDFTFETVLSSKYKLDMLYKAKEAGYFIKCIFVLTADPVINVSRVVARVANGGHGVEESKIISRYNKSLSNIKILMEICDILHVYDNTMQNPVRIIRKHKEYLNAYPNDLWSDDAILILIYGEGARK